MAHGQDGHSETRAQPAICEHLAWPENAALVCGQAVDPHVRGQVATSRPWKGRWTSSDLVAMFEGRPPGGGLLSFLDESSSDELQEEAGRVRIGPAHPLPFADAHRSACDDLQPAQDSHTAQLQETHCSDDLGLAAERCETGGVRIGPAHPLSSANSRPTACHALQPAQASHTALPEEASCHGDQSSRVDELEMGSARCKGRRRRGGKGKRTDTLSVLFCNITSFSKKAEAFLLDDPSQILLAVETHLKGWQELQASQSARGAGEPFGQQPSLQMHLRLAHGEVLLRRHVTTSRFSHLPIGMKLKATPGAIDLPMALSAATPQAFRWQSKEGTSCF